MRRIQIGDIFEINTSKGKAYLHYIHNNKLEGAVIRVLQGLYSERPEKFEELVTSEERYIISFPLSVATKRKIVENVGHYPASNFSVPRIMRSTHKIGNEFIGWFLIDCETNQRRLVKSLTPEQKKLSPWGIWNDTLLIERLENDWSLDNW
jgi:hypothetical protein